MASPFERAITYLEQYWDASGLDHLLDQLHGIHDVLSLRATSRVFKYSLRIRAKAFSTIHIHVPPHGIQSIGTLPLLGQNCHHLIIRVAYSRPFNPDAWYNRPKCRSSRAKRVLHHLQRIEEDHEHERNHNPSTHCTNLQQTTSPTPATRHFPPPQSMTAQLPQCSHSQPPPQPAAYKYVLQRRPAQLDQTLIHKWHQTLSLLPKITTLTFSVNGDPNWPGCTDIEMLLVYLRIAIEHVNFKHIQTVRFSPIHAGGLMYLRWAGLGAFGEAAGKVWADNAGSEIQREMRERECIWQRLQRLELWIRSPYLEGRASKNQKTVFESVLRDHLRSFRKTLKVLVFGWGDGEGPNPLLLEGEPGEEDIEWDVMEGLWLKNCVLRREDLTVVRNRAKRLKRLMVMLPRATHPAKSEGAGGQTNSQGWSEHVWTDVLQSGRDSSPSGSQKSAVSDSSRIVPIKLDV